MQVRPREMHVQRLHLAVWVFNCIVVCVPHLRRPQMNAETQYLVSGCHITSKPIPQPVSSERGHGLGVTGKTAKVKRVSFQLWVTEEKNILELWGRHSAFYFCLNLSAQTHFESRALGHLMHRHVCLSQSLPLPYCIGNLIFSYSERRSYLLVYRSKRWRKRKRTTALHSAHQGNKCPEKVYTLQCFLDCGLLGPKSRQWLEAGQTNSRI